MSNTYGASGSQLPSAPMGGSMGDLVNTQKGGVLNLAQLALAIANAMPPATSIASPKSTPINNLGTTAISVLGTSAIRHGVIFHNPATSSINLYIFPSLATPAPTLASTGGAFLLFPGGTLSFSPSQFPNVNAAWSAFAGTGTNQQLTVVEFF